MGRRVAQATTINQVMTDLSDLRQDVERLRRTARSSHQQDALGEAAAWKAACSVMQALPGLRLFVPMSSFDENGDAFDLSGQDRTMSYNGDPTYNYDGLAPYINLDGTGDYLSRADEAGLDILGTESYVAAGARGLTLGGWFWADALQDFDAFLSKFVVVGNGSYLLRMDTAVNARASFLVSVDGLAITFSGTPPAGSLTTGAWHFIVGRFDPSAEVAVYFNGTFYRNAVAIPASIFNSNADFAVGGRSGGTALLDGRASLCFLCAAYHSDALVRALFAATRGLFRRW